MLQDAVITFMCICPAWGVSISAYVHSQEDASHKWQVIGQIKAKF